MKNPPLQPWQKFSNVDRFVLDTLRGMLRLPYDSELPEVMWVVMGIHRAMECQFSGPATWSARELSFMVMESQALLPKMDGRFKFTPGQTIHIESMNIEAVYWHTGPMGLHLVNSHGDVYLVPTDDIQVPNAKFPIEAPGEEYWRKLAQEQAREDAAKEAPALSS